MPESVDAHHLLLIGAGPGVAASVVRRFGREGFRSTLISRAKTLEQLAPELRRDGLEIEAVGADIEDLDGYRATLERIFLASGAPGVAVYNAALPDPGEILETTVGRLRTAYDVDVLGAVVAAQVAAPVLRSAGTGTERRLALEERAARARAAGIGADRIVLDAGLDLGKTAEQSLTLLRASPALAALGYPLLLSASNKTFLGKILDLELTERGEASLGAAALGIVWGCRILRVHDVLGTRRVRDVLEAIGEAS